MLSQLIVIKSQENVCQIFIESEIEVITFL